MDKNRTIHIRLDDETYGLLMHFSKDEGMSEKVRQYIKTGIALDMLASTEQFKRCRDGNGDKETSHIRYGNEEDLHIRAVEK